VDVWVKGERLEFLIDSGATPTIITERTRARLGLSELGGGQRIEGVTATGSGAAPRVMLNEVSLLPPAGREGGRGEGMVNMDALVMGNEGVLPPGVDGLLGVVWMRSFGVVDFSWATETITVYPYDVRGREGGSAGGLEDILEDPLPALLGRGVPMRQDPRSGLHFVDLFLKPGGSPVSALVDLGAGMSIVNWRAARQAGIERYVLFSCPPFLPPSLPFLPSFVDLCLRTGGSPVSALVDLSAGMSIVDWRAARQAGIERYVLFSCLLPLPPSFSHLPIPPSLPPSLPPSFQRDQSSGDPQRNERVGHRWHSHACRLMRL